MVRNERGDRIAIFGHKVSLVTATDMVGKLRKRGAQRHQNLASRTFQLYRLRLLNGLRLRGLLGSLFVDSVCLVSHVNVLYIWVGIYWQG